MDRDDKRGGGAAAKKGPAQPEKKKFSDWFMPRRNKFILFDPAKCTGCGTCEMICSTRNVAKVAPAQASVRSRVCSAA